MSGSVLMIIGWLLLLLATATLLRHRTALCHYDRQILSWLPVKSSPLHAALQNRITTIDRWGASLTAGLVLYAAVFLIYLLYQSFERIAHALLQLLSYI